MTREVLERYKRGAEEIRTLQARVDVLMSGREGLTASYAAGGGGSGGVSDPVGGMAVRLDGLGVALDARRRQHNDDLGEVVAAILALDSQQLILVAWAHYVMQLGTSRIARVQRYSRMHVSRLLAEATEKMLQHVT